MSKMYKLVIMLLLFSSMLFAQKYNISGVVTDANSGESLIGANVYIKGLNIGTVTDADGKYVINNVPRGTYAVVASFIGYITKTHNIAITNNNVEQNFTLKQSAVLLGETVVQATRASFRETPVAFSQIDGEELEFKLASRDVPQMLLSTPGVYATARGGGAGDARLNIRGFDQRNIDVMINGVPVNDMENGWVYWSNWAGLGDVTSSLQVQRGLGASPYSVSSVGGVVNIVTNGVGGRQEFAKLRVESGSDNLKKTSIAFSTSITENIGITALVSNKTWDGYADQTWLKEFTYFFSIGGVFGDHSLELTGVGSPQQHGQRYSMSTINTYANRGYNYNPSWGYLNGEPLLERKNFYHKPAFNLNWNWQLSNTSILSTIAYFSFGTGGGTGGYGDYWRYSRTDAGLRDWDAMWAFNSTNIDSTLSTSMNRSTSAIRASRNDHKWYGLLSTYKKDLNDNLTLHVGFDGRYYVGTHYRTLENLLGGDYYSETRNKNRTSDIYYVGDTVNYYNDGIVMQYGGFTQLEYKADKLSAFINIAASQKGYKRIDYFNFLESDPDRETDWQRFLGYAAKGGLNFNINEFNNVFFNAGYYSKAPIFGNVFDYSNGLYKNIENEKVLGLEVGYGVRTNQLAVLVNAYYTNWKDRALTGRITNASGERRNFNVFGSNQNHVGFEFEGKWKPRKNVELNGSFHYEVNKYGNDVTAVVSADDDPTITEELNVYLDGIHVGDFPMTVGTLGFAYRLDLNSGSSLYFNPVWKYFGRLYANFDPQDRDDPTDREDAWRLPDYYLVDIHARYDLLFTDFFFKKLSIGFHLFNALNRVHITDADDGRGHDAQSASVYYGRERSYNVSLSFEF